MDRRSQIRAARTTWERNSGYVASRTRSFRLQKLHSHDVHSLDGATSGLELAQMLAIDAERKRRLLLRQTELPSERGELPSQICEGFKPVVWHQKSLL